MRYWIGAGVSLGIPVLEQVAGPDATTPARLHLPIQILPYLRFEPTAGLFSRRTRTFQDGPDPVVHVTMIETGAGLFLNSDRNRAVVYYAGGRLHFAVVRQVFHGDPEGTAWWHQATGLVAVGAEYQLRPNFSVGAEGHLSITGVTSNQVDDEITVPFSWGVGTGAYLIVRWYYGPANRPSPSHEAE